ncbi:MAG: hypothetical protein LBL74_05155 [Bacteroidales bacterium]|nr:hypothetical protein [Bacteroidales bacterium]
MQHNTLTKRRVGLTLLSPKKIKRCFIFTKGCLVKIKQPFDALIQN